MLTPRLETATAALDLAFRRQKPTRAQLDDFAAARAELLDKINPAESEEHLKTHLRDFLAHPGVLGPGHYLNVRKRRDLVARLGPKEADPVGLLIEVKKFANAGEMVTPTDLNRRALHELLLYYLEDRDDKSAEDLRRLIITNGYEWFIFDSQDFRRLFWDSADLKKQFRAWAAGGKADDRTKYFYNDIAKPFLAALDTDLKFTYLDLRPAPAETERTRLHLHKVFHPAHLLKLPFAQDANTLNRAFYEELLYLIGLEEVKDKGRKLIRRCAPERRQSGALLENTIAILDSTDQLTNLTPAELARHGTTPAAQTEAVALELCLTWVNRLLFLKLLEGQLRRYHAGNAPARTAAYRFLTPALLPDYDTLNRLFFQVLNRPAAERTPAIQQQYAHLPYLNSSLYEPTELERRVGCYVSNLYSLHPLPLHRKSVLPAPAAPPLALAYLLQFLDAYDFASEGDEQVQESNKLLISAAVLGLIFEKLNGYQDGSFYTPGFITMYMARHTLRRAVLQHFNRRYSFGAESLIDLENSLDGKKRPEYSAYFNTLTVLDPAVGSGHFLVSALNELLAIKAGLGLLLDDDGRRLPYRLSVARDELAVENEAGDFVQYLARLDPATGRRTVSDTHTRLQRALFREKRHLMEHALFGVDLNPNSVRICRLRLWIELLKHAYYRPETDFQELETLPNLDLNIKTGNSLLARFPLAQDLSDVFKKSAVV